MNNILKKHSLKEAEKKELTATDYENKALALAKSIQDFLTNPYLSSNDKEILAKTKTIVAGYSTIKSEPKEQEAEVSEDTNIELDAYDGLDKREVEDISKKAPDGEVTIVSEANDGKRFYGKIQFDGIYAQDLDNASEIVNDLMLKFADIAKNHDITFSLDEIDQVGRKLNETLTKEEALAFIRSNQKGYVFEGLVSKKDLLGE